MVAKVITAEYIDVGPKVVTEADYTEIKVGKHPERLHGSFCVNGVNSALVVL